MATQLQLSLNTLSFFKYNYYIEVYYLLGIFEDICIKYFVFIARTQVSDCAPDLQNLPAYFQWCCMINVYPLSNHDPFNVHTMSSFVLDMSFLNLHPVCIYLLLFTARLLQRSVTLFGVAPLFSLSHPPSDVSI